MTEVLFEVFRFIGTKVRLKFEDWQQQVQFPDRLELVDLLDYRFEQSFDIIVFNEVFLRFKN